MHESLKSLGLGFVLVMSGGMLSHRSTVSIISKKGFLYAHKAYIHSSSSKKNISKPRPDWKGERKGMLGGRLGGREAGREGEMRDWEGGREKGKEGK